METKYKKTIEKKVLVDTLREIKHEGIIGVTKEEFTSYKDHPVYIGFTMNFASKLETDKAESFSPEDYSKLFVETIENYLKSSHEAERLKPGQLHRMHNYFDALARTTFTRILGELYGKEFTEKAIEEFDSHGDFFDLYNKVKRGVA